MSDKSTRTLRVFLCHASDDKPKVRELHRKLIDEGVDVWFDEKKLLPGQDWRLEISRALRSADAIIVCLSNESTIKEGFVQKEIRKALDIAEEKPEGTIFLIPVRLEDCPIPDRFADIQYVNLYDPDGYQKLLSSLNVRAEKLGVQLAGRKLTLPPSPDMNYELSRMVKGMIRGDAELQDELLHLAEREPDPDGWFHEKIRAELQHVMADKARPVTERARAGDVLTQVGDPRFRPDAWFLPDDDFLGFVEIPAGPFIMGSDTSNQSLSCEGPQHQVDLPKFYINRFPVTVAQYKAFLKETNSRNQIDATIADLENHPIASATWQAAMLYCRWLTDMLCKWPGTPKRIARLLGAQEDGSSWVITLPSEAEWEKAARGMADARVYPWGPLADPNQANYKATGLGKTSPVGCFEGGKSPYGIQDMSGNVWEWTRSNWGSNMDTPSDKYKYPYHPEDGRENILVASDVLKVFRGGSFLNPQGDIRCSCRGADLPNARREHVGFRLAITWLAR